MTNSNFTPDFPRRFDAQHLERINADYLKPMSRLWGGRGNEKKADCIRYILNGLTSVDAVNIALRQLSPAKRASLALLKAKGGGIPAGMLEDTLLVYGYSVIPEVMHMRYFDDDSSPFVAEMISNGLLLLIPYYYTGYADYSSVHYSGGARKHDFVFADERMLQQVDWSIEMHPFSLAPAAQTPAATTSRRSALVTLDLMAITQALAAMKPLSLTRNGGIRVADLRQFSKRMGWEKSPAFDGYKIPQMAPAVLDAWRFADWLHVSPDASTLSVMSDSFMQKPYLQKLALLAGAFINNEEWCEIWDESDEEFEDFEEYGRLEDLRQARFLFFHSLRALPDTGQFYALPAFMEALYDRVGEVMESRYSYAPMKPSKVYNKSEQQYQQALAAWRPKHKAAWIARESVFGEAALTTWLYWLGLVELGRLEDHTLVFRLTDTARAILAGEEEEPVSTVAAVSEHPAWVVQPNYDIIAYLDAVTPAQLAFLEIHAERRQAEAHTAHFQLTRDSVYRGLQQGTGVEELLETLRTGARMALPQNVEREIRDWAGQREQITITRKARLIAFPTPEQRTLALESGLKGKLLGDRYVRVAAEAQIKAALKQVYGLQTLPTIDYAQAPEKCLQAGEDGTVKLVRDTGDLLVRGQLARCAEPVDATHWRITPASLARVRQAGVTAKTLLTFLQERVQSTLPPILEVIVGNALGTRDVVEADTAFVLRVTNKKLHTAITTNAKLKPLLLDVPGPDTIIVSLARLDEFKAQLDWLGIKLTAYNRVDNRPDWQQTVRDAKTQMRRRGW